MKRSYLSTLDVLPSSCISAHENYSIRDANGQIVLYRGFPESECLFTTHAVYEDESMEPVIEFAGPFLNKLFYDSENYPDDSFMTVSNFLSNLITITKISTSTVITALVLINRLKAFHPNCKGSSTSGYRLLLAAILLASKTMYDDTYNNKSWASASDGMFDVDQVNQMEKEFLAFVDYRVFVSPMEWTRFAKNIPKLH